MNNTLEGEKKLRSPSCLRVAHNHVEKGIFERRDGFILQLVKRDYTYRSQCLLGLLEGLLLHVQPFTSSISCCSMTTEDESEDSFKERSGLKATCIQDLPTIESTKEVDEVEVKFDTSLKICCHHNL
jgi:hypothetical protein